MRENTYASVTWRVNSIRNSKQPDNCRVLVEKLIQSKLNDWPKFQEQLKKVTLGWNSSNRNTNLIKRTYNKQREIQWNDQRKTHIENLPIKHKPLLPNIQNLLQNESLTDLQSVRQKPSKIDRNFVSLKARTSQKKPYEDQSELEAILVV